MSTTKPTVSESANTSFNNNNNRCYDSSSSSSSSSTLTNVTSINHNETIKKVVQLSTENDTSAAADEIDNARFGCPKGCDIATHRKSPEVTKLSETKEEHRKTSDKEEDEQKEEILANETNANKSHACQQLETGHNQLSESANHHSVGGSPNSTGQYRHTVLANFNSWFSEISSSSLFHNFLISNPFRRRNSRNSAANSPCVTRSNSKFFPVLADEGKSNLVQSKSEQNCSLERRKADSNKLVEAEDETESVRQFIGAIQPTLKGKELIELANFGVVEIEPQESGTGHRFEIVALDAHTFCDNCSEFIWTPVVHHSDTISAEIVSPYAKTVRCVNCRYTCHYRCSKFVRINCQKSSSMDSKASSPEDDKMSKSNLEKQTSNESDPDSLEEKRPDSPLFVDRAELEAKIKKYNERIAYRGSGLGIYLLEDGRTFRGFLRVHMNLTRPINVIAGTRPPSIYDIMNDEEITSRRTLTTFYMPRDTVKNIHINSLNTSIDVIKAMLKKFKMVDNRQKFALYKKQIVNDDNSTPVLSRIGDNEHPLQIALDWLDSEDKQIVLQENDTADVNWDEFHLPELNNFLKILDREEKEHFDQVKMKYEVLRAELEKLINYKTMFSDPVLV